MCAVAARQHTHVSNDRYMPFDDNAWSDKKLVPYMVMQDAIKARFPDVVRLENDKHDTAKTFAVPGFEGTFGFITSMSQHFCGGCNRLRLTADGNIKVRCVHVTIAVWCIASPLGISRELTASHPPCPQACLFGAEEFSLRDAMRAGATDEELLEVVGRAVAGKHAVLGGNGDMYGIAANKNRPMITIGG